MTVDGGSNVVKHAVILAGGVGTRLWPASTKQHPKQFLRLEQGRSLFAMTLQRAIGLGIDGMICVVTHRDHVEAVCQECEAVLGSHRFPSSHVVVLAEPEGKNTAPAIAYACAVLNHSGAGEDTVFVMPADHSIAPLAKFTQDVSKAARLAERGWLVTFGIPPERPETGYGYIEVADKLKPGFRVRKFKEKPDEATARSFLAQGNHYWNSGMFAFRTARFLEELGKYAPEVARPFLGASLPGIPRQESADWIPITFAVNRSIEETYRKTPSISIDYAVMEHSEHCAVVPASFAWSDVGSWDVVAELFGSDLEKDQAEQPITIESEGTFVLSDVPVALGGVKDLIVVVNKGAVLICRRGKSQLVKDIVQTLKDRNRTDLL
jgi:mannose-1-phosphate guanylyltransferase/mannose-6-phosphate isomerase